MHAFQIGDRVIVHPSAFTRAGESCVIIDIYQGMAGVRFDDGDESAYIISDGELVLQDSFPIAITVNQAIKV